MQLKNNSILATYYSEYINLKIKNNNLTFNVLLRGVYVLRLTG